ncbi:hypothetical protein EMIT0P228_90122 [Pseudomonas brassicacearum]
MTDFGRPLPPMNGSYGSIAALATGGYQPFGGVRSGTVSLPKNVLALSYYFANMDPLRLLAGRAATRR